MIMTDDYDYINTAGTHSQHHNHQWTLPTQMISITTTMKMIVNKLHYVGLGLCYTQHDKLMELAMATRRITAHVRRLDLLVMDYNHRNRLLIRTLVTRKAVQWSDDGISLSCVDTTIHIVHRLQDNNHSSSSSSSSV